MRNIQQRSPNGRGAISNRTSERFNLELREEDGDWLDAIGEIDGPIKKSRTKVTEEFPKSILSFNKSPDIPFDRSINAYRGCEHGCIYCYARPSHAFHDLSPGLDFETQLFAKPDAAKLLRQTLAKPGYRVAPIAMGTNTDPYQPIEGRYQITRQILEVMVETRHPVGITTKSDRILRDLDLLNELAKDGLVAVAISITTLDSVLARRLEPRASSPAKRLAAVHALSSSGIPVHVNIAPVIPAITDHELEALSDEVAEAGASGIGCIPLRLPHEVAALFQEWLSIHFPDRSSKVMHIQQEMRGGSSNDPRFGMRMRAQGIWGELLANRMSRIRRKHGFQRGKWQLNCAAFKPPNLDGQLALF